MAPNQERSFSGCNIGCCAWEDHLPGSTMFSTAKRQGCWWVVVTGWGYGRQMTFLTTQITYDLERGKTAERRVHIRLEGGLERKYDATRTFWQSLEELLELGYNGTWRWSGGREGSRGRVILQKDTSRTNNGSDREGETESSWMIKGMRVVMLLPR